jgi:phosphatidylglycerophosphate synthase
VADLIFRAELPLRWANQRFEDAIHAIFDGLRLSTKEATDKILDREVKILDRVEGFTILREKVFSVPNLLSFSRIPLGILEAVFIAYGVPIPYTLGLLIILMLTDRLDGSLARRWGTTRLGAFIDPACDKAFVLITALAVKSQVESWLFWSLGGIETILLSAACYAIFEYTRGRLPDGMEKSNNFGKYKFALECFAFLLIVLHRPNFTTYCLYAALVLALLSILAKVWEMAKYKNAHPF